MDDLQTKSYIQYILIILIVIIILITTLYIKIQSSYETLKIESNKVHQINKTLHLIELRLDDLEAKNKLLNK